MKGDFSKWHFDRKNNFSGVLHQQGRVLLDSDWNDQTRIIQDWQSKAGQDLVGLGVAAVPISEKDGFSVREVWVDKNDVKNDVKLKVTPGKLWADGFIVTVPSEQSVVYFAPYLKPPDQKPSAANPIRDLILLEVWVDSISGFQVPDLLLEPALGGPDTTERVHTEMAFKLLRLEDGDTCENIANKLRDDLQKKGKLSVSLKPSFSSSETSGCPKVDNGGYTGLEHSLYRIEIAEVKDSSKPMFKWSQFNGGLVGRGEFHSDSKCNCFEIKDNLQAIISCGLDSFYLEVVNYDKDLGYWRVTYGATVSLNGNSLLVNKPLLPFTTTPDSNEILFFRLWNGIKEISEYQKSGPVDLPNNCGIQLKFEAGGSYSPQDYWTFPVRAGGKGNTSPLIDKQPPEGIRYHRVPLAIVKWKDSNRLSAEIADCRNFFASLTDLYKQKKSDCTLIVSPGEGWEKIFAKIAENQDSKVCFQVGEYLLDKPIELENKGHLRISGCGEGTRIISSNSEIVFKFVSCKSVTVKDLYAEAGKTGSKKEEKLNNQNGALTFCACSKVTIEGAVLKCAAGAERAANCIDVRDSVTYGKKAGRNPALVPVQSVRVHNCDLSAGHMQSGILLINVRRANIENNIIQVYDTPQSLTLKVLLENKRYRSAVRSLMIYSPTLGELGSTKPDPSKVVADVKAGKGSVWFFTDQMLATAWKEWLKLSPALGVQNNHDMLLHMIHVADDALLGEGVLKAGGRDFFGFKKWYDKLSEENVAVGSQGIVIAGTVAEETHIVNNTVSGFMQGIHVGTSHREVISGISDSSGIVQIMSNNVRIQLSPVVTRERHGIFVGNRNSLIIQNNYISVHRGSLTKDLRIDGIRVYGHPGRMMIVNQNHIVNDTGNFNTGIFFGPMSCESDKPQWVIAYNIAIGAKEPVKVQDTSKGKVFLPKVLCLETNFS